MQNAGHGAVFACVAVAFLAGFKRRARKSLAWQCWAALLLSAVAGVLTEFAQIPLQRDPSWLDAANDVLGAWVGIACWVWFERALAASIRRAALVSALVPVVLLSLPVVSCAVAYAERRGTFPVIADFTETFDDYFLSKQWVMLSHEPLPGRWAETPGERALLVAFGDGEWPGINFDEPIPNWERYAAIVLDLTNSSDTPLPLGLRIHDAHHNQEYDDRFNSMVSLPAQQRIVMRLSLADVRNSPRTRSMEMSNISDLSIFMEGSKNGSAPANELFISRIWLE